MKLKSSEVWYKFILLLFTVNVLLFTVPSIYLKLLDNFSIIVSVCFALVLIMKAQYLGRKTLIGICIVSVLLIGFTLAQGRELNLVFTILSSLAAYFCFDKLKLDNNDKAFLKVIVVAMWVFFLVRSPGYYEKYMSNTMEYINPNTMGMISLDMTMLLVYFITMKEKKDKRRWIIGLCILELFVLNNYKARGCIFVFIVFCLMLMMKKFIFANNRRFMIIFIAIIIVGLFVPFIYMTLARLQVFGVQTYTSKDMYTRVQVWGGVVDYFLKNRNVFIMGFPNELIVQYGERLHNTYFQLLVFVGAFGFVAYYAFVFNYIRNIIDFSKENNSNYILIASYCSLLILGYTEVSMFWAVTYMTHYIFLGIASGENRDTVEKKKNDGFY